MTNIPLTQQFQNLRQELKELQQKQVQFESDLAQHERVLESISSLNTDRKCYRLMGEALVQSTIGEAQPALEQQRNFLKELVQSFNEKIKAKEEETLKFQKDHNIQIRPISDFQNEQAQ